MNQTEELKLGLEGHSLLSATLAPPPRRRIVFGTGQGPTPVVGTLYLDDGSFEGDPHESAKIFWEELKLEGKSLFEKIKELEEENRCLKVALEKVYTESTVAESAMSSYRAGPLAKGPSPFLIEVMKKVGAEKREVLS